MKKVVAIDFDDVVVATAPLIIQDYNKRFGTKLTLGDLYVHDLERWDVPDDSIGIQRVDEFLKTKAFQDVIPLDDAITTLHEISQRHELHVVTGRPDHLEQATRRTMETYFPGMFHSLELTNFLRHNARSKADICRELGADVFIDDHIHHAQAVAKEGIDVLLFGDYPWNQSDALPQNVRRALSWRAIHEQLLS